MENTFLKEITCQWCSHCFWICHSCWRCQVYCSASCKCFGYRRCRQKRQEKYRKTDKGKKTRRKAERNRSLGLSEKKSGDATSNTTFSVLPSSINQSTQQPFCQCCKKNGQVVAHFPPRRYGNRLPGVSDTCFLQPRGRYDTKNPTHLSSSSTH